MPTDLISKSPPLKAQTFPFNDVNQFPLNACIFDIYYKFISREYLPNFRLTTSITQNMEFHTQLRRIVVARFFFLYFFLEIFFPIKEIAHFRMPTKSPPTITKHQLFISPFFSFSLPIHLPKKHRVVAILAGIFTTKAMILFPSLIGVTIFTSTYSNGSSLM